MRHTILASAAALAIGLAPGAFAQNQDMAQDSSGMEMPQRSAYDGWPPERQRMYDAWEPTVQAYYWTLSPDQQEGWWLLTDDQRTRLFAMAPQQREQAWMAIRAQLAGAPAAAAGTMQSSPAPMQSATAPMQSSPRGNTAAGFISNPMVQSIAADQAAPSGGEVPICNENEYDNCMNAWEAGRRGPNVTKPLEYWPGEATNSRGD